MPERIGNVVLERSDPLRGVLVGARRLDDFFVIHPGHARQGQALLGPGCLVLRLRLTGGLAALVALVDGIEPKSELLARSVRQTARQSEAVARLGSAAAPGDAQAHLASAAGSLP